MIDTSKWKEFRVGDLFEKLDLKCKKKGFKKSVDCSEEQTDEFSLPLTNAKHLNNGIQFYGRPGDWDSAEMTIGIVSNGAIATGDVYAHPEKTGVLWDSYLIKCKQDISSEHVLQYLACIMQKCIKQHFGWNDKCTWNKVKNEVIKLPVKLDGQPDWGYMGSYMKDVMRKQEEQLNRLKKLPDKSHIIDTSEWGEFRIGDLFEKLNLKCRKKDFNKATDVSLEQTEEFNLPLVNAKHNNNGIMYYGREEDWDTAEMTIDIVGDGAASTGDVYAQPQKTGVLYNAYLVKPLWNCNSEHVLQFMACVIEKCVKEHFGYENKCTWDKVKNEIIKLPITSFGEPDWEYMEEYMHRIHDEANAILTDLQKVSN